MDNHKEMNIVEQSPPLETIVGELGKKFPTFCGTRKCIVVFIRAHHWS
jgi:hypothetical protein